MKNVQLIPLDQLALMLIPIAVVFLIYVKLRLNSKDVIYGSIRMLSQLILVGFVLNVVFDLKSAVYTSMIFCFMLFVAAWISTRTIKERKKVVMRMALALFMSSVPMLLLVMVFVLSLSPWYEASYFIPLAGMILSNSMNSLSLAADRLQVELERDKPSGSAHTKAFENSLIPTLNSFYAVGLVSLPGMMTGQILSGINPLIAVRYQIVVMAMVLGASGLSSGIFLYLEKRKPTIGS